MKKITVPAVSLDSYVRSHPEAVPDIIKIDVEGGGDKVLDGSLEIINSKRPLILFESHLPTEDDAVIKVLKNFNYTAYRVSNAKWVLNKSVNHVDPDGVWGTMLLIPEEKITLINDLL